MKQLKVRMMFVAAAIVLGSSLANAASEVVIFKVTHFMPPSHNFHQLILLPWCDKINKESDGKLKCQIYPSLQLGGTPAQLFDQMRDGVSDIAFTVPSYQAGRFTKSKVFELPFMVKSSEKESQALWDYIQKNALDEFKGAKLITTYLSDGSQLHFGSKSVKTMDDFKGLKIRASGRLGTQILTAFGAIPVQMPIVSVSEAISKNVVDGAILPWEVATPFKLQEVTKTHTETPPNQAKLSNTVFIFAMNLAKYNSLSPELKKIIDQNSGREISMWMGKLNDSGTAPARKIAVDRHNTINVLSDAEYKRWVKATENIDDEWIKEVNAKGGNGKALLNDAKALLKKYSD